MDSDWKDNETCDQIILHGHHAEYQDNKTNIVNKDLRKLKAKIVSGCRVCRPQCLQGGIFIFLLSAEMSPIPVLCHVVETLHRET